MGAWDRTGRNMGGRIANQIAAATWIASDTATAARAPERSANDTDVW